MKIVHFIASSKPWLQSFNTETRLVTSTHGGSGLQELLQLWWDLFCHHVHPGLSTEMVTYITRVLLNSSIYKVYLYILGSNNYVLKSLF